MSSHGQKDMPYFGFSLEQKLSALFWGVVFSVFVFLPDVALAAASADSAGYVLSSTTDKATTLGGIVCNIKHNMASYPGLVDAIAYTIGAFFTVRGILLLKKHGENPTQPQMTPAMAHLLVAAFLLSFPAFIGALQTTFFGSGLPSGNLNNCNASTPTKISGSAGLDQMMQNFVENLHGPFFMLLSVICIAVGLTFVISGLLKAAKTGTNPQAADPKLIISHLIFGSILVSMGSVLPDMLNSLFGSDSISSMTNAGSIISWSTITSDSGVSAAASKTMSAVFAFIQIIGGISFVRGWLIMKKAVEGGQATIPQGFTHIIGGAMAINIDVMLKIINETFGLSLIN